MTAVPAVLSESRRVPLADVPSGSSTVTASPGMFTGSDDGAYLLSQHSRPHNTALYTVYLSSLALFFPAALPPLAAGGGS